MEEVSNMKTFPADTFVDASKVSFKAVEMPRNVGNVVGNVIAVPGPRGYLRQDGAGVRDAVSEAVLDVFTIGIVVVNSARQVVRLNRCASDMLQKSTSMALCSGRLVTVAPELNRRLAAIISTACQDSISSEFLIAPHCPAMSAVKVRVVPLSVGSELATMFIAEGDWSLIRAIGAARHSPSAVGLHQIHALVPSKEKLSGNVSLWRESLPHGGKQFEHNARS
jgi:hypothetical protein